MRRNLIIATITTCLVPALAVAQEPLQRGYFRFPSIHQETIIFTAEGDLWKVSTAGGAATRLTTHIAQETSPAISPDGTQVAFSAGYEGPREVYCMPLAGGRPRRLTYDGESSRVVGWTPDGRVVYSTRHYATLPNTQLVLIHPQTRDIERVPLHQASDASWTADGTTLFFTRLSKQSSSTKRYRGGTAETLWKFTRGTPEALPLTANYTGTSRDPMLWQNRLYFASDRDGTMNLWSMNLTGADLQQHTRHADFDVLAPAHSNGQIVYQRGADLHLYSVAEDRDETLSITLSSDFEQTRLKWIETPVEYLTDFDLSPDGKQIALTVRGNVFVTPAKQGRRIRVTRQPGMRFRGARFLAANDKLIALSDKTGEFEFHQLDARGLQPGRQLSSDGSVFRYPAVPSPDGKWIAYRDKNYHLWLLDVDTGKPQRIAQSEFFNFRDLTWSPNSQWLAYVADAANHNGRIHLYQLADQTTTAVTTDRYDNYSPSWSPDGHWLYFLSDRHFSSLVRSPWGLRQPEPYFDRTTQIYELALNSGSKSPFAAPGELDNATGAEPAEQAPEPDPPTDPAIQLAGIADRLRRVPVTPGNFSSLTCTAEHLYLVSRATAEPKTLTLKALRRKHNPEVVTILSDIKSYDFSLEASKLLIHKGNQLYVIAANGNAPGKLDSARVPLNGWTFSIDPVTEWRAMFIDAWRMERDYFYDPNLHNKDWKEILDRHLPLVDRVTDRAELNDLIAQMVGELETLHIYVRGGDHRALKQQITPASLGATFRRDAAQGGYRVEHIYRSDPDLPDQLSPLANPDVNLSPGAIIESVNGIATLSAPHLGALLRNQTGKDVLLQVRDTAAGQSRQVIVKPISPNRAANLRYDEWEYSRRLEVDKQGDGKLGYIHLRAMSSADIAQWTRHYYPVFHRQGLILDVRHNRGGNIDSWILEKLLRKAWFYWKPRVGAPYWNMQYAFRGHMVVLCNERTASDGEAFAEGFRRLKLGPLIGTRTWGGEIWLSINNRLVDRGYASAAQTAVYGPEREWLIEGHGVDPDVVIDNLPHATFNGKDAQLEAAIAHLLKRIEEDPVEVPAPPAYPRKTAAPPRD
ncbi:MAG: protease [Planctomycetaceae bacterium]|nr:protease [Planctomycetaceae bacterium]